MSVVKFEKRDIKNFFVYLTVVSNYDIELWNELKKIHIHHASEMSNFCILILWKVLFWTQRIGKLEKEIDTLESVNFFA